jgi:hypothetical protein
MPDLGDLLDAEARRMREAPDALASVLRRAGRRRQARRIASGILALAVAGATFGLAYAAFRPSVETGPTGEPVTGPSVTPTPSPSAARPTPPPFEVLVVNVSGTEHAGELAVAMLRGAVLPEDIPAEAVRLSDGSPIGTAAEGTSSSTRLFCHPALEDEAGAIRDVLFPGAELRPRIDADAILVAVGEDFVRENGPPLANLETVRTFMTRRVSGSAAEPLLSEDALRQYRDHDGGLSLYDYAQDREFEIVAMFLGEGAQTARIVVRISEPDSDRTRYETLTVGPGGSATGPLEILAAERNE